MKIISCATEPEDHCALIACDNEFSLEFTAPFSDENDKRDFDLNAESARVLISELQAWLDTQS